MLMENGRFEIKEIYPMEMGSRETVAPKEPEDRDIDVYCELRQIKLKSNEQISLCVCGCCCFSVYFLNNIWPSLDNTSRRFYRTKIYILTCHRNEQLWRFKNENRAIKSEFKWLIVVFCTSFWSLFLDGKREIFFSFTTKFSWTFFRIFFFNSSSYSNQKNKINEKENLLEESELPTSI